jgi:ATP-dependent helicase YprA (DUF1998 family)
VNVFDLDRSLVGDYERFARSFTQIRSPDIRARVEEIYTSGRFWPEPLISINPHFERGASITALVTDGSLRPETASVFRVEGQPITLHRHQAQAIAKATAQQSFVVTTGTGSGKSLCFFGPIIDAAIRARISSPGLSVMTPSGSTFITVYYCQHFGTLRLTKVSSASPTKELSWLAQAWARPLETVWA